MRMKAPRRQFDCVVLSCNTSLTSLPPSLPASLPPSLTELPDETVEDMENYEHDQDTDYD